MRAELADDLSGARRFGEAVRPLHDLLQRLQFPNLRQNTANFKVNYGLPLNLELDFDAPYLGIFRTAGSLLGTSAGIGDTNMGIKWNFHKETPGSRAPALSATFYVEFPTGNIKRELGSGLSDYALNLIAQKHVSKTTRLTVNAGLIFSGNTSTGSQAGFGKNGGNSHEH